MKGKILYTDPMDRFRAGETGDVLPSDYYKYDYMVTLPGKTQTIIFGKKIEACRCYYFFKDEVEIVED